jgi:predicted O-methyltransferase YrrM
MTQGNIETAAASKPITDVSEVFARIRIPTGNRYVAVREVEGEFMHRWVKEHGLNRTLEVGLAYGASACCIMSAHEGRHVCMDPFQSDFGSLGLENLTSLGFRSRADYYPALSQTVLPQLVAEKRRFDFAFIDGNHLYDGIFVDFFYVDSLLDDQGYVLFHDAWMRGTQLVASFIKRNRKDYRQIPCPVRNLIMFQKIGKDDRAWHHFREFYTWRSFFSHRVICGMMRHGLLQKLLAGKAADESEKSK